MEVTLKASDTDGCCRAEELILSFPHCFCLGGMTEYDMESILVVF